MPDIGAFELLVIAIVALIVVGPKDLPKMFRKAGQFTGRMRAMAKEFTNAMNAAADDTGMTEINKGFKSAAKFAHPGTAARDFVKESFGDTLDDIDPSKYDEGSHTRALAEKKAAAQAEYRAKVRSVTEAGRDEAKAKALAEAEAAEMEAEPDEGAIASEPSKPKAAKKSAAKKPAAKKPAAKKPAAKKPAAKKAAAKRPAAKAADTEAATDAAATKADNA